MKDILDADAHLSKRDQRKVIIYTHWTNLIWALQMYLARIGIFSSALHGSLTMEEPLSVVDDVITRRESSRRLSCLGLCIFLL